MAIGQIGLFGRLDDGTPVDRVTLRNSVGITAQLVTYGATLQALEVPDRNGVTADVVLGYSGLADYVTRPQYFGASIGRFANRICRGSFHLDGRRCQVPANDGSHALHGGQRGFDKHVWAITSLTAQAVTFRRVSEDGEEGFPGTLTVDVTYSIADDNALTIAFAATTDCSTVVNLTNHTYFNLGGEGSGTALKHVVTIASDHVTEVDKELIPTGELIPVAGTPLDFRTPQTIDDRVRLAHHGQIASARGYDFNYVLRGGVTTVPREVARVADPASGRAMTIETTEPGLQFYSGNFLDATTAGKAGRLYRQGDGIAFETQHFPDSPNHPHFPTTRLDPGGAFHTATIWRFSAGPSE